MATTYTKGVFEKLVKHRERYIGLSVTDHANRRTTRIRNLDMDDKNMIIHGKHFDCHIPVTSRIDAGAIGISFHTPQDTEYEIF